MVNRRSVGIGVSAWLAAALASFLLVVSSKGGPGSAGIPGASGFGSPRSVYNDLWVPNCDDNTVSVVDVTTRQVVRTIPVGKAPMHIAVGIQYVWVTHRDTPHVYRIDRVSRTVADSVDVSAKMAMPIGVAVDSLGYGYVVGRLHATASPDDQAQAIKVSPAGAILNTVILPDVQGDDCDPSLVMGIGVNRSGAAFVSWARSWNTATGIVILDTDDFTETQAPFSPFTHGYLGPGIGIDLEGNGWTVGTRNAVRQLIKITVGQALQFFDTPCQVYSRRRDVAVNAWGDVWAGFEGSPSWLVSRNDGNWGCYADIPGECGGLAFDPSGLLWVTFPAENLVRSFDGTGSEIGAPVTVGRRPLGYGDMTGSECGFRAPERMGACCFGAYCLLLDEPTCRQNYGTYQGDYQSCSPNPCPTSSTPLLLGERGPAEIAAVPNPSDGGTRILYQADAAAPVQIEIYDAGGRMVRRLGALPSKAGRQETRWDGSDDEGKKLPSGIYLTRVSIQGKTLSGRILIVR